MTHRTITLLGSLLLAGLTFAFAAPQTLASGATLTLVAYSTPAAAYAQIIPAFQKTQAGQGVTFQQSYGASGDQSLAVANGLHADIVAFALEPDINYLEKRHIVRSTWYKNPYHGFVTDSIVVFVVRKGNPKHIHTWADLIRPGVDVICPNPFTSGGARWDIMAAYGAQIKQRRTKRQAVAYLRRLYAHISVQDSSARNALNTFTSGKGDVLLDYENEAIGAQQKGLSLDYVIPPQTILIENPVTVTTETKYPVQANAFVSFLYSTTAQRLFGQNGYRPVRKDVLHQFRFKSPKTLFTIRDLGSWPKVQNEFFNPELGIVAGIERAKGVTP
jgi:sulfate transport system substrate-binding protein